jgi:hypothetical protein
MSHLAIVTLLQMLGRAGHGDLSKIIETYLKEKPSQLRALTLKSLSTLSPAKFATIGVVGQEESKALKRFQEWWQKTSPESRMIKLTYINYFSSCDDRRSEKECVHASEEHITKLFLKSYPNNVNRVTSAVKSMITSSHPHTQKQLDHYLTKYAGKPSMAQDRIGELIDVMTLPSEKEEQEAYKIYFVACKRITTLLKNFKIRGVLKKVNAAVEHSERILSITDNR